MALSKPQVIELVKSKMWPLLVAEQKRCERIDRWMRWDHDSPHKPRHATREYRDLAERSQAPWGRRVVSAVTDQLYVEGYRAADSDGESDAWRQWQQNGMDARQIAIHEAAVGYGLAYAVVLPGRSWLDEKMALIRACDPSQMVAVYRDPAWDDWPEYALRAEPVKIGDRTSWRLRLFEAEVVHHLLSSSGGEQLQYQEEKAHAVPVCPVIRYTNHLDLRGRADGDIEPIIPLLGRIDQTTFDRLVVQRFASWKVRTATGLSINETVGVTGETPEQAKLRLQVSDFLVAEGKDARFGTLDGTPLDGYINAHDADVRVLAAVSQSPAHELIGQMANMSAEALAAAEMSLTRRVVRVQYPLAESHEKTLRLSGFVMGDQEAARDHSSQIRWRDMESKSFNQAADALGKVATMLGVPVEMLWERLPNWTQQDTERAKQLIEAAQDDELLDLVRKTMTEDPEKAAA